LKKGGFLRVTFEETVPKDGAGTEKAIEYGSGVS